MLNNVPNKEDIELYSFLKKNSDNLIRDDLRECFMKWVDSHPEYEKYLESFNDSYTVKYVRNGEYQSKTFTGAVYGNPYFHARKFYGEICNSTEAIELWLNPNPYRSGQDRIGKLILSYEAQNN